MATNTSMESQISKGEWRKTESEEPNPPDARSIYYNGKAPRPTIYAIKIDWVLTPVTNNIKKLMMDENNDENSIILAGINQLVCLRNFKELPKSAREALDKNAPYE
ncbi:11624_t:CDS:2 [Funneliformis caledonium]|uniref:11624_t:CDS:1 n=1 Tax=Funneliformis caledonium TaxID=1117310 RepID=A0A9N9G7H3_9GLOM|nr:11624_t:CDS:2 [Funneliformis caledonium]